MDLDLLLLRRQVARLLEPWNRPDMPGCAIGVVRDGQLILHRAAGQASLELGQPIGPDTTFRIASVTKQFTCAAVLMLAAEGKLGLDDDIRRHLPELPELGRISVDQLMHNMSGLRDMLEIMRFGGLDLSYPCRPADLMAGICRQRGLNFPPGSRFLYSNTNFLLLGLIVERLSGEPLGRFLDRRIFTPLGMTSTRLVESTTEVVPQLANGYLARPGGGWLRAQHGYPLGGEGGVVSSVQDLALWERNYATGRVGGAELMAALQQQVNFSNGSPNAYARGLEVKPYRGLATVSHGGLWPGYKTEFLRVPARALTVICIANNALADPYDMAHQVLDVLIDGQSGVQPIPALPPRETLARLPGRYVDRANLAILDLSLDADGAPRATMHGTPFALAPTADGRLAARRGVFPFVLRMVDPDRLEVELDAGHSASFQRVAPNAALPGDLAGRYASAEIGATWMLAPGEGGRLTLRIAGPVANTGPWEVEPVEGDIFRVINPAAALKSWTDVRAERNAQGRITALTAHGGRVRGVSFARVEG